MGQGSLSSLGAPEGGVSPGVGGGVTFSSRGPEEGVEDEDWTFLPQGTPGGAGSLARTSGQMHTHTLAPTATHPDATGNFSLSSALPLHGHIWSSPYNIPPPSLGPPIPNLYWGCFLRKSVTQTWLGHSLLPAPTWLPWPHRKPKPLGLAFRVHPNGLQCALGLILSPAPL